MINKGRWIAAFLSVTMIMSLAPGAALSAQEVSVAAEEQTVKKEAAAAYEEQEVQKESDISDEQTGKEETSTSTDSETTEDGNDAEPAEEESDSSDSDEDIDADDTDEAGMDVSDASGDTSDSEENLDMVDDASAEVSDSEGSNADGAEENASDEEAAEVIEEEDGEETVAEEPAVAGEETGEAAANKAEAEEQEKHPDVEFPEYVVDYTLNPPSNIPDSDQLFEEYANRQFYGSKPKLRGSKSTGSRLPKKEKIIYDKIRQVLPQIASGEEANTKISVSLEELGLNADGKFYAEDLGLDYIYNGSSWNEETYDAANRFLYIDYQLVQDALYADYPYELYWGGVIQVDKFGFTPKATYNHDIGGYVGFVELSVTEFTVGITVQPFYRNDSNPEEFVTDAIKTGVAASAASYAKSIIQGASAYDTDYGKLEYFKNEICGLVDYNNDAAEAGASYPDSNAWALIYVFDQNPETNVVCEGYAEAFQYLCNQTDFIDDSVCAYSVTGNLGDNENPTGGGHKWNIVHMDDGFNYMADITNSDEGSFGQEGRLFLRGATEGNADEGYYFCDDDNPNVYLSYVYDASTLKLFSKQELTLSGRDYGQDPIETDDVADMYGISLLLTDKIGLRVHVKIDDLTVGDNDYIEFEHNGNIVKQLVKDAVSSTQLEDDYSDVVFELPLTTTEMTDVIDFKMVVGGKEGSTVSYSVKSYAEDVITNADGKYTATDIELAKSLLHYGSYAQQYINYNVNDLPNAGQEQFDWDDQVDTENLSLYKSSLNCNDNTHGFLLDSMTLILGTDVSMRFYFDLGAGCDVSDFTIKVIDEKGNAVDYTTGYNSDRNLNYIMISNIKPLELGKRYNLLVYAQDTNLVDFTYGPLSYCYYKVSLDGGSDKIKNLCKSLFKYYEAVYKSVYGETPVN